MRISFPIRVLLASYVAALIALSASAEKRAFIVGVGEYDELTDLQKTVGDAAGYSSLFGAEFGYAVSSVKNQKKRRDFVAAFDEFVRSISPGDEVVFVFSGHGWSDGAENYLSFSDAPRGVSEAVLRSETIALKQDVMARLRARRPKVLLAIIDACRDENYDPLTKSAGHLEKGIVRISANEGELILYSAAQGQTSLDRLSNDDPSDYSVFTRVLLPKLRDTSKPLARIANETRTEVQRLAARISHPQRPEMMLGIDLDFCLSGACTAQRVVASQPTFDPVAEAAAWERAKGGDVPELLNYLSLYPRGPNAESARTLITMKTSFVTRAAEKLEEDVKALQQNEQQRLVALRLQNIVSPAGTAPTYTPGSTFRDTLSGGSEGPEMVVVPAGSFMMGSPASEKGRFDSEGPQRRVTISKPFAVGKFEVTWAEWEACVADGGCESNHNKEPVWGKKGDAGWGKGGRPVIHVDWNDAKAYVRWLSRKTGETYRLLSEAEWEYVARAGTTSAYSWGGSISSNKANCDGCGSRWDNKQTAPVGSFSANAFGLYDLHGNVAEWTEDCWIKSYSGAPNDGSAWLSGECNRRVLRGGSWASVWNGLRSAARNWRRVDSWASDIGFRIARDLSD